MQPPGSRGGRASRHLESADLRLRGERPARVRPWRRGSPDPVPNSEVKPALAESTAASGCGRLGRRTRAWRFPRFFEVKPPNRGLFCCIDGGLSGQIILHGGSICCQFVHIISGIHEPIVLKHNSAYGVGQRSVLRSKTAAERSERPPVYYKKVVILL